MNENIDVTEIIKNEIKKNQKDQIIYLNYQKKNKMNILIKEMNILLNLVLILETMFGGGDHLQIMF